MAYTIQDLAYALQTAARATAPCQYGVREFESDQRLLLLSCMAAVASDTAEVLQHRGRKEVMEKVCSMQFGASEAAKLLSSTALARLRNLDLPYCGM